MAKLPDSDDPYALLGVAPGVDPRELKRAYVRLIKDFKPEQLPEAFQRIRQAYELLRAGVRSHHLPHARPQRSEPPPEPEPETTQERAEQVRVAPPFARDEAVPERAEDEPPRPRATRVAARFVDDAQGEESQLATREAVRALLEGDEERARPLLDALHAEGKLSWEALRSRSDTVHATMLFAEHIDRELIAGRGAAMLDKLSSAEFEREVLRVPALESAIWRLLAFTSMQAPEATLRLLRAHPGDPSSFDENLTLLEENFPLAEAYQTFGGRVPIPPGLKRLIELGRIERTPGPIAQGATNELLSQGPAVLAALDQLHAESPLLVKHVLNTTDQWMPADDRLWQELSLPERAWLNTALKEVDEKLGKTWLSNVYLLFFAVLGTIAWFAFSSLGLWLGALVTFGAFVAMAFGMTPVDAYIYKRDLRDLLLARIAARGVSPDRVVEWLANTPKEGTSLRGFNQEIEADLPLYAAAALHRVRTELLALRKTGPRTNRQASEPQPQPAGESRALGTPPQAEERPIARPGAEAASRHAKNLQEFAPGSAFALEQHCAIHTERRLLGYCNACKRATCRSCAVEDPDVGLYCTSCQQTRHEALRQAFGDTESKFRALGSMIAMLSATALFVAVIAGPRDTRTAWSALGVAILLLMMALPPRLLWRGSRYLPVPFCCLVLFAFPIGTAIGLRLLGFVLSAPTKRLFSDAYRNAIAATPHTKIRNTHFAVDVLAAVVAGLALLVFVMQLRS